MSLALFEAIEKHSSSSVDEVELLLQRSNAFNILQDTDQQGRTPLIKALSAENGLPIARLLLEYGADVNAKDARSSLSPIIMVVERGDIEAMRLLLEFGATLDTSINDDDAYNQSMFFPLGMAAYGGQKEIVELSLFHGVDVNGTQENSFSALHLSSCQGYAHLVHILIEHGANVHKKDPEERTALHDATRSGCCDIIELLLDHDANVDEADSMGMIPLHCAIDRCHMEATKTLISRGASTSTRDSFGYSSLFYAVNSNKKDVVLWLLNNCNDIRLDSVDDQGRTVLHHAMENATKDIIELLIDRGVPVNLSCEGMDTPIHYLIRIAMERCDDPYNAGVLYRWLHNNKTCDDGELFIEVIQLLVRNGATIDGDSLPIKEELVDILSSLV